MGDVSFRELLSRADDETLQQLIGRPVVRLLSQLDEQLSRPSQLRELLVELRSPVALLRQPDTRAALIQLLRPAEAQELHERTYADDDRSAADAFVDLMKDVPRKGSRKERAQFAFFDVVAEQTPNYDATPEDLSMVTPSFGLFEHQRDAATRLLAALGSSPHRVVLHMPTGSGKTRTALSVIVDELRK